MRPLESAGPAPLLKGFLGPLDDQLAAALQAGHIRLVRSRWICTTDRAQLLCRQDLEELEATGQGERPLLSNDEAVSLLRGARRSMGALSYAWGTSGEPDPSGEIFAAMRVFLSGDHGRHIEALFWDF
eukprot:2453610-Prymnesium_polylepis.1